MKVNHNQFLLWFGAAISIAEIITGTLIAPLGLVKGSLAIIIGHLIGAFLLLLPASFLGGTRHQNAIELTAPIYGKSVLSSLRFKRHSINWVDWHHDC